MTIWTVWMPLALLFGAVVELWNIRKAVDRISSTLLIMASNKSIGS